MSCGNPFIDQAVARIKEREAKERHMTRAIRMNHAMILSRTDRMLLRRCAQAAHPFAEEVVRPSMVAGACAD